ncbi:tetratricopeptide repeat protein [Candidatus Chloroploca sp. M-50]|uniref:Tetratricopeptide repeat protein n=1 Tax=Candidatus Chloroploca mongolica TaxID=2528176 RepID=A0ABS4D9U1_9CHLR|nr:tetratricopeptide repeat protein [Candidatus Chloroploca mongolica]MBP1466196.1 tetratricopeptide repeat protein [Candidatus Chloroploca mongolica]
MELTISSQSANEALVRCDGVASHCFIPREVLPAPQDGSRLPNPLDDPVAYGRALFTALFPTGSLAHAALAARPERIVLVAEGALDAVPWEYLYGPDGFVVLEVPFVRGLPIERRVAPPTLDGGLHIVAVPSNPLDAAVVPLNIDGEWLRLRESVQAVEGAVVLERTRPATDEQLRRLVAGKRHRVVHFMGHGSAQQDEAQLCFERADGGLELVSARTLAQRLRGTVFLVTLNACVSATPGPTPFSNLARLLIEQGTPYALGMRFSIVDDDARAFARTLYDDLARGVPIEEALLQARLSLARSARPWAVGVPVLYTALTTPAGGFATPAGQPDVRDRRPPIQVSALPRAEGAFQGRQEELRAIGAHLTGDSRPPVLTIHGIGGQGKTALAREVAERFAWAFPGGVWAISLESLPSRELVVADLARFYEISSNAIAPEQLERQMLTSLSHNVVIPPEQLERQVLIRLSQQRTLLIFDNAETLIAAVEAGEREALRLVELLRQELTGAQATLLVTSRSLLGWPGEIYLSLGGLSAPDGARLFRQSAPARAGAIDQRMAEVLSARVEGHPLSLRLLGGAFNDTTMALESFVAAYEAQLAMAHNTYLGEDHRHRTLYASIETSVRYLAPALRDLLSGLWIFHAPFLPETAQAIFDPAPTTDDVQRPDVRDQLHALWQRGLIEREQITLEEGRLLYYRLHPILRLYAEHHLQPQAYAPDLLQSHFATIYLELVRLVSEKLNNDSRASSIAQQVREDFERGLSLCSLEQRDEYQVLWGLVTARLGDLRRALQLCEAALERLQGGDTQIHLLALQSMALVYQGLGQPQRAIQIYEEAMPVWRAICDRAGEAITLRGMAEVYQVLGQPQRALALYEEALSILRVLCEDDLIAVTLSGMAGLYMDLGETQRALQILDEALPILRAVGDRSNEAVTLNYMATVYRSKGQPQQALQLYDEALPLVRAVGNRAGEATTLNGMAMVYQSLSQFHRALQFYEEVLPIWRAMGNPTGEAATLNNMATVYQMLGEPMQALQFYEKSLLIRRMVSDLAGEAYTLNNMAELYRSIGQPQRALLLCEEAILIWQSVGNANGKASTLNNMAIVYQILGQPERSITICDEALPIWRAAGNPAGEASTLNVMAEVYRNLGQPTQALQFYEKTLPIFRTVGDRVGEAQTLNNMALLYHGLGQPDQSLQFYDEALSLCRMISYRTGEAATLHGMAMVYQSIGQPERALHLFAEAIPISREIDDWASEASMHKSMALVYQTLGQPQRALQLLDEVLPIFREVGNRTEEADTLNGMALVYQTIGQPQRALELFDKALSIWRAIGNRAGEAAALNAMGMVYQTLGQPQRAFELFDEALPILRKVGSRAGEAEALLGLGVLYQSIGQPERALELFDEVLPIWRAIGNRAGEAAALNAMGMVYQTIGQPTQAFQLFDEALPIWREIGNRAGEAATLSNMASLYQSLGQPEWALELYEEALPICREVGNRTGEAVILSNMAYLYMYLQQFEQALMQFEASILLAQQTAYPAVETASLIGQAILLYQHLERPQEAMIQIEAALQIFVNTDLPQDISGNTPEHIHQIRAAMQSGESLMQSDPITLPTEQLQVLIASTVAVLTSVPEHHSGWRDDVANMLMNAQQRGNHWQMEVDLYAALLALLDGELVVLAPDHPYAPTLAAIQVEIDNRNIPPVEVSEEVMQVVLAFVNAPNCSTRRQVVENHQSILFSPEVEALLEEYIQLALDQGDQDTAKGLAIRQSILKSCQSSGIETVFSNLMLIESIFSPQAADQALDVSPIDPDLVPRSIVALLAGPQEKMAHAQYLNALAAANDDQGLTALVQAIQTALFGGDLAQLGAKLTGPYAEACAAIVAGVEHAQQQE